MLRSLAASSSASARATTSTCLAAQSCRQLSTTARRSATDEILTRSADDVGADAEARGRRGRGKAGAPGQVVTFREFIEGEGAQYREPTKPRQWLGNKVPFPLNQSFKPPTPLSDALRTSIYAMHEVDPQKNTARDIASKLGLSIPRVEAILKLKALEDSWKKEKKQLQNGFQMGMERILGVEVDTRTRSAALRAAKAIDLQIAEINAATRQDTQAADAQSHAEGKEGIRARERYTRMYWEMVDDTGSKQNLDTAVPQALERGRQEVAAAREKLRAEKAQPGLLLGMEWDKLKYVPKKDREAASVGKAPLRVPSGSVAPDRPSIQFKDVGGKFLDVEREQKKAKEAKRRERVAQ